MQMDARQSRCAKIRCKQWKQFYVSTILKIGKYENLTLNHNVGYHLDAENMFIVFYLFRYFEFFFCIIINKILTYYEIYLDNFIKIQNNV